LTSWLVIFSMSLIACASLLPKFLYKSRKGSNTAGSTVLSCGNGSSHKAIKYSISISTRYLIKASSEKYDDSETVLLRYLPSMGDTAFSSVKICIYCVLRRKKQI